MAHLPNALNPWIQITASEMLSLMSAELYSEVWTAAIQGKTHPTLFGISCPG